MGHPFIVRTDIDAKFTADTAMYMEMLHREYSSAYQILLGEAADVKEKIEVIIYADQGTYAANGGMPGSGGFFTPLALAANDRSKGWPARHYRLVQFTDGVTDFAHWPKGTLKHESAHMELQLRLGFTLKGGGFGYPIRPPLWFNEGQATNFEYWDFDKTVEENFAEIPKRGRYAPFIRRIHDTPKWQDFDYVWDIDPGTWQRDMTREQGFLNYAPGVVPGGLHDERRKGRTPRFPHGFRPLQACRHRRADHHCRRPEKSLDGQVPRKTEDTAGKGLETSGSPTICPGKNVGFPDEEWVPRNCRDIAPTSLIGSNTFRRRNGRH